MTLLRYNKQSLDYRFSTGVVLFAYSPLIADYMASFAGSPHPTNRDAVTRDGIEIRPEGNIKEIIDRMGSSIPRQKTQIRQQYTPAQRLQMYRKSKLRDESLGLDTPISSTATKGDALDYATELGQNKQNRDKMLAINRVNRYLKKDGSVDDSQYQEAMKLLKTMPDDEWDSFENLYSGLDTVVREAKPVSGSLSERQGRRSVGASSKNLVRQAMSQGAIKDTDPSLIVDNVEDIDTKGKEVRVKYTPASKKDTSTAASRRVQSIKKARDEVVKGNAPKVKLLPPGQSPNFPNNIDWQRSLVQDIFNTPANPNRTGNGEHGILERPGEQPRIVRTSPAVEENTNALVKRGRSEQRRMRINRRKNPAGQNPESPTASSKSSNTRTPKVRVKLKGNDRRKDNAFREYKARQTAKKAAQEAASNPKVPKAKRVRVRDLLQGKKLTPEQQKGLIRTGAGVLGAGGVMLGGSLLVNEITKNRQKKEMEKYSRQNTPYYN